MKELKLVDWIRKRAGKPGKKVETGIGDDCAVLGYDKGHYLLWATDMLVEDTHFKLKKASYKKIGHKAVAVNISDIAAMGGVPKYITVTIGIPSKMKERAVGKIYDGIFEICKKYGVKVVGGDTNKSSKLLIDVSIMGIVARKNLLKRNGARKGDLILITGPVRDGRKRHLDFEPRVKEAQFLADHYRVSSMIDVSDGIALDVSRISSESRVGCRLYESAVPLARGLSLKDALYYGESFELLFTMPVKEARKLFLSARKRKEKSPYFVIGEITSKNEGLILIGKEGNETPLKKEGFRHL